jgi:tRNA (guanine37-N1)-methyltransferase
MRFCVLTLFPEMIRQACSYSILGRAVGAGLLTVDCVDIRDFAANKNRRVDDAPYGGGAGMVMSAAPVVAAYESVAVPGARFIYLTPQGRVFDQPYAEELSKETFIILLCGHYEGLDERAVEILRPEEVSVGDYILTGGELAALVVIDAVARLVPGVLGANESSADESFSRRAGGLLEYPQYTRPQVFRGLEVPSVLLSGHHAEVEKWRRERSRERTAARRPDLL